MAQVAELVGSQIAGLQSPRMFKIDHDLYIEIQSACSGVHI